MKIVVNHLTRMKPGFMCVAGIDMESRQHVRPQIAANKRMETFLLASRGGPFDMGAIVDIGQTKPVGAPPHVEDHEFDWMRAKLVKYVQPDRFWRMLKYMVQPGLTEVFGHELTATSSGACRLPEGKGKASLGCICPVEPPCLELVTREEQPPTIRIRVNDGKLKLNLGVTDVRLCGPDNATPIPARVHDVATRLESGIRCILSVGVGRPFARTESESPEHWLHVNNIHLEDDPGWRLCRQ